MPETVQDLQSEQVRVRCHISQLYGELLQITPVSRRILNVAHDWSLRNIETIVQDILVNIPNHKDPVNTYSSDILVSGVNPQDLSFILDSLVEALHTHSTIGLRIEQVAKGVA